MNETTEWVIRRILVALDASAHSLAALEEAAELAASLEAELVGLFVEDINLVRLAGLPFARQISYPSGKEEPLNRVRIDREFRIRAEHARKALAAAAERKGAQWSFRIVRGQVTTEILAASAEADLILLGKAGWSPGLRQRLGSTALALAAEAPGALLLVQQAMPLHAPILTVYDGSTGSQQALRTAIRLARARRVGLIIFLLSETVEATKRLQDEVRRMGGDLLKKISFRQLADRNPLRFVKALRAEGNGLVVLSGTGPLAQEEAIRILLQEVRNPVLLIRHKPSK